MNCPICNESITWEDNLARPFCSERCRLLDLEGWLHERYRVSVEENGKEHSESGEKTDSQ